MVAVQFARVGVLVGTVAAGVALTAGTASAAKPSAPSVGNTTQTLSFPNDGSDYSTSVVFTEKTFTVPEFRDSGAFTNSGGKLKLRVKQGTDKGCIFTGTYDASSTDYVGTYHCNDGTRSTFTLTTDGGTPTG